MVTMEAVTFYSREIRQGRTEKLEAVAGHSSACSKLLDELKGYTRTSCKTSKKIAAVLGERRLHTRCCWQAVLSRKRHVYVGARYGRILARGERSRAKKAKVKLKADLKVVQDGYGEAERPQEVLDSRAPAALPGDMDEKDRLQKESDQTAIRLTNAERLTSGLAEEGVRWKETVEILGKAKVDLIGDVFMSCAAISYYGPFPGNYRTKLVETWSSGCSKTSVPASEKYSLANTMGNPVTIKDWQNQGLPTDEVSTNSAILVVTGKRWPLMIDPQGQANKWLKNLEEKNDMQMTKMNDINLLRTLESCIRVGKPLMLEDIGETLEPALEPVLQRATFKEGNRILITLGDTNVDYDPNFKLYMTTKLPNPHYLRIASRSPS